MPHIETVQLADPLESNMKLWCSDCLGGAAAAMSLSQGSFADAMGAELEAMDAEERERDRHVSVEAGVGQSSQMEEIEAVPNPQMPSCDNVRSAAFCLAQRAPARGLIRSSQRCGRLPLHPCELLHYKNHLRCIHFSSKAHASLRK